MSFLILTVVDCGPLTDPVNGAVDTSSGTTFTNTATYTCNSGFGVNGGESVTCRSDGNWSPNPPTCERELILTVLDPLLISYCVYSCVSWTVYQQWRDCVQHFSRPIV